MNFHEKASLEYRHLSRSRLQEHGQSRRQRCSGDNSNPESYFDPETRRFSASGCCATAQETRFAILIGLNNDCQCDLTDRMHVLVS